MPRFLRSFNARLAAIATVALALRVAYTVLIADDWPGVGDFFYYHGIANLLADGRGFVDPFISTEANPYPSALHPPLWPLTLAAASELGVTTELGHRLVGTVVGTGTVVLIGLLGRRVGGDRVGLLAAAIAAVYPTLIASDGSLMSETLYGLWIAAALVLAYRLLDRPSAGRAAVLGAVIGLAALTRGEAVLFVPLLALPLAFRGGRPGRLARLAATLAATALVIAPWTLRNWVELDRPILISTNDSTVVAGANCASVYSGQDIGFWHLDCISERRPGLNEAEQAEIWRREGQDYAEDHLGRLLAAVVPVRVLRTWDLYQPRRQARWAEGRSVRVTEIGVLVYYVLLVVAAYGVVLMRRRGAELLILLAPVIAVTLSSAAGFGLPRFRQAAEISIVVLAAVAVGALSARRSSAARGHPGATAPDPTGSAPAGVRSAGS
jgi:4-amino-4-deoxy-L-arabinose transferase-like glycosyltransferase